MHEFETKSTNTTQQKLCQKEMHKFEPKKAPSNTLQNLYHKKTAQIRTKKESNTPFKKLCQKKHTFEPTESPNNTLKTLCQEKRMHKFELKKHPTLSHKN